MKNKVKVMMATILVLLLIVPVFAGDGSSIIFGRSCVLLPGPRLCYPVNDEVVLTGKDFLEFRWWNDCMRIDHFIFKIYKGYTMYGSDLVHKQNLPAHISSLKIKSELFQDGQVYTWSLQQVSLDGQKSDKSFNSFKVIKN